MRTIGVVARETGVPAKTIRYYESIGLVAPPERAANGYRVYREPAVERLRFVKRARELGFSIEHVGELLGLWSDTQRASSEVQELAMKHVERIAAKIAELEAMRRAVLDLAHRCHGDARPDCPILDDLAGSGEAPDAAARGG